MILFCLGRYRIRTLVSFFSLDSFFGLPVFRGSVVSTLQGCFIYLVLLGGLFEGLSLFSDSVDFSFSKDSFFLICSGLFHWSSSPALFFSPYIGLLCLLRMPGGRG